MGLGPLLKDNSLKVLMSELVHLQIGSKASLTTRKYFLGWDGKPGQDLKSALLFSRPSPSHILVPDSSLPRS